MKQLLTGAFMLLLLSSGACADGLYDIGSEAGETLPLKWISGLDLGYDDHLAASGSGQSAPILVAQPPFADGVSSNLRIEFNRHHHSGGQQAAVWLLQWLSSINGQNRLDSFNPLFGSGGTGAHPPDEASPQPLLDAAGEFSVGVVDFSGAPVPEPSAMMLVGLGAATFLRRRGSARGAE